MQSSRVADDPHHFRGTGLGLYLIDVLARACCGRVHDEPNLPQGSWLIVTLSAVKHGVGSGGGSLRDGR